MNPTNLAPVYLDDKPVTLQDAKPNISAILAAATQVKWLRSKSDTQGKAMRPEEVVDRTSEPTKAIYLTTGPREASPGGVVVHGPASKLTTPFGGAPGSKGLAPTGGGSSGSARRGAFPGDTAKPTNENRLVSDQGDADSERDGRAGVGASQRPSGGRPVTQPDGVQADDDTDAEADDVEDNDDEPVRGRAGGKDMAE